MARILLAAIALCGTMTTVILGVEPAREVTSPPLLMTLECPGQTAIETSEHLLFAWRAREHELRLWDWDNLNAAPKTTPVLGPYPPVVLHDGRVVERVWLGTSHSEVNDPRYSEEERDKYRKEAAAEDQFVAQMKYLQKIARTKKDKPVVVVRNLSGTKFSVIHTDDDKDWFVSELRHSPNGKFVGVV